MIDWIENLNEQQRTAVQTVHGPVLVLAGPGSGKTRVLTRRIAYLIDQADIAPWKILAVTFTNKAANEMRARIELVFNRKFGAPLPGQPPRLGGLAIGTFHSICARVLRVETEAIGYERNWVIYDKSDQLALIRSLLREMNMDEKRYSPQALRVAISRQKNEMVRPEDFVAESYFEEITGRVYTRYQQSLQANNAMDFDDLLGNVAHLFKTNDSIRVKYQQKWPFVLVDEFQDTNTVQYELLRLLVNEPEGHRNLFVVGDEDQSIYRFRGADYRNVRRFREDYPEAVVVLLEQNYRSTQTILDAANALISHNRNRTPKQLRTDNGAGLAIKVYEAYNENEEASYLCDEIERLVASKAFDFGDFAVMYRTNAQSRAIEEAFVVRQMKYKLVGATRFYERKEIKDVLAYLKLVHNPNDTVAMDRIINAPARGIGAKTYGALKTWADSLGVPAFAALQILHHGAEVVSKNAPEMFLGPAAYEPPPFGKRAGRVLSDFSALLEQWIDHDRNDRHGTVAELMDAILLESGYVDALRDGTDEGEDRFANVQELRGVAAQYTYGMVGLDEGRTPLSLFLEEVSLVSDVDDYEANSGAVTLLTLHMAKGLEFPIVFMVGMEDGILPHSRSLDTGDPEDMDEERRLCYVGMTRAKKRLHLLHAYQRSLWGRSEVQEPSRFFHEIPAELLSGMVDRQSRRQASYARETTWDSDDWWDSDRPARKSRDRPSYRSQRLPSDTKSQGATYWSPGESGTSRKGKARASSDTPRTENAGASGKYKRRDSVEHPSFGVGTVIECNVVNGEEEVTVAFPGIGIKRLLASLAGLKKL